MSGMIIKNKDIIVVGQQPWDVGIGSNCKNIALEFSKHNRVLYINSPLDRISSIREKNDDRIRKRMNVIMGKEKGLVKLQHNLWNLYPDCLVESVNWIPVPFVFDLVNKYNARKFVASIRRALQELNFKDYLLFNDNEIIKCFYLQELLRPVKSIYYSRDYILATDYWKKRGPRLEPLVIAKSDLCVANSPYLTDYCKGYNPKAYYVGQGCELEIFQKPAFDMPEEMKQVEQPVIGYVGALITSRLDIDVLMDIARKRPDWSIVLVGPEDEGFTASALHSMPNVRFTGSKPAEQLPDYINTFDVCINPQILNGLTIGNYPRKIDEYLAMGKPVVATHTRAMDIFEDYTYLADNKQDFVPLIAQALQEHTQAKAQARKEFAATHTWENSVAGIYQAITVT